MTGNNPMSFFSDNVDAWGPLEWFDRLAKAVRARNRAVSEKDDLSFELYQNIASSSATRLVSDFEDKVRMALTTLRELEKANVAYVDANTELLSTLESLQRENERLQAEIDRTERNRDMYKGQVERQAVQIEDFRSETKRIQVGVYVETLPAVHLISVFADDMNERNWDDKRAYIKQQADRIRTALASTGGEHNAE
jgi:hypothetical protein